MVKILSLALTFETSNIGCKLPHFLKLSTPVFSKFNFNSSDKFLRPQNLKWNLTLCNKLVIIAMLFWNDSKWDPRAHDHVVLNFTVIACDNLWFPQLRYWLANDLVHSAAAQNYLLFTKISWMCVSVITVVKFLGVSGEI